MDTSVRVIDYIRDFGEYVQTEEGRISASAMLERFLFTPDMQYTPVEKLSGGGKETALSSECTDAGGQCAASGRAIQ